MADGHPRPRIGVSFRRLSCYAFVTREQCQATFASSALAMCRSVVGFFRQPKTQRVQILRDFEGLVRPGEMLLVLGRPGSGCSTFLKTLCGFTRGFFLDSDVEISYHGKHQPEAESSLCSDSNMQ